MNKKILTLCIVYQHPKVLLGLKKRGFGEGRWNGFGGKVELGETVENAARREVREEAGIEVRKIEKVGILDFEFARDPIILQVHIFRADEFNGKPAETDEMRPEWYDKDEIPFHAMWPDDQYWFPLLLAGKKFQGKFWFDGMDTIINKNLREVETLV